MTAPTRSRRPASTPSKRRLTRPSGATRRAGTPRSCCWPSLSACHQLWYLALYAENGVVVTAYEDNAQGTMIEEPGGAGQFSSVTLRPRVSLAQGSDPQLARTLHTRAHEMCFIARSVNFPIECEPAIEQEGEQA